MILGAIPELLKEEYEKRKEKKKKKAYEAGLAAGQANIGGGAGMSVLRKKGGKVSKGKGKPRGVGCATRGYGKALTGRKK